MVLSPASTAEITLLNNVYRCSTVRKCRGRIATVFYQNTEQGEFTTCMKDTGWWRFKNWEVREEKVPREAIYQLKTIQNEIMKRMSFSSVQSLSRVRLFATPWIAARQAPLSITNSWSSFGLTSIESVMPSSHLILCRPLLHLPPIPPNIRVFSNESTLCMRWPKYWSFSFSIVPSKEYQDWSPLGWTGWVSLQSKGLSRVFSNTTVQKHLFFGAQLSSQSNSHIHIWPQEKPQPWLDGPLLAK